MRVCEIGTGSGGCLASFIDRRELSVYLSLWSSLPFGRGSFGLEERYAERFFFFFISSFSISLTLLPACQAVLPGYI